MSQNSTSFLAFSFCTVRLIAVLSLHCSEFSPEGKRVTKLDSILLNGNNIAIVRSASLLTVVAHCARVLLAAVGSWRRSSVVAALRLLVSVYLLQSFR